MAILVMPTPSLAQPLLELEQESFGNIDLDSSADNLGDPFLYANNGLTVQSVYIGEVFSNTRGGIATGTRYLGLLDIAAELEFEQAKIPLPGRFFLLAQQAHGQGLTQNFIGDTQVISNIDPGENITQISEYWWEFDFCDEDLRFRIGKQDLNHEFLWMPTASDFIHSAFGLSPGEELPSYPAPSMAAIMLAQLHSAWQLKLGVWDAFSEPGNWGISGNDVVLSIGELEYQYELLDGQLPGNVAAGLVYTSGGEISEESLPSSQGYYLQFEQLIFRENGHEDGHVEGLGVFAQHFPIYENGITPRPKIPQDSVAGIVYTGLFPRRNWDVTGVGVAYARLVDGGTNREIAYELFYKFQLTPWMCLQPDLQYVVTPTGIYPDALAVGLRFQVDF